MDNDDLKLDKELEDDEDLLNFDLDDISEDVLEGDEEEIIELVNLVEKGPEVEAPGDDEFADLFEEESASETEEDIAELATDEIEAMDVLEEAPDAGRPEEETGMDLGDISLSDLDVEGIPAAGDISAEADTQETGLPGVEKPEVEGEISLDLGEEVEGESAEVLEDEELTEGELEEMLEGKPAEGEFSLDFAEEEGTEGGGEQAEGETVEDDLEGLLEDVPADDLTFDLEEGGEGAPVEAVDQEGAQGELEGLIEEEGTEELSFDLEEDVPAEPPETESISGMADGEFEDLFEEKPADEEFSLDLDAQEAEEGREEGLEEDFAKLMAEEPAPDQTSDVEEGPAPEELSAMVEEAAPELTFDEEEVASPEPEISPATLETAAGTVPSATQAEEVIGLSEEKLEAVVARVVEDVVERVVRETMAEVAEKVITETIAALKQSIDSSSE